MQTAGDAGHAVRLLRQAELLEIAGMPGVVALVGLEGSRDDPVLVTGRVEGTDLSRGPELTVEEVAGLVAELAGTLAELHDRGVVHGAVMAEHVLVSTEGRPVLCGFGYGARMGDPPVAEAPLPEPAVDPARAAGGPLSPASDVFALGALLEALLDTVSTAASSQRQVDGLRAVAARTRVAAPGLRPKARALAEAVRHAVPSARLPGPSAIAGAPVQPKTDALHALRRRGGASHLPVGQGRQNLKVVVGLALVVVVLGALVVRAGTGGSARPRLEAEGRAPGPSTSLAPPDTAPPRVGARSPATTAVLPPAGCPGATALLAADTDGDGCPEALRWEAGVVESGDRRWSVGAPGDLAVTGDWTCAGVATLAVLRPSTGQVFVFSGWATPGRDLSAPQAVKVEGALALRAADLDADACPDLVVERAGRSPAIVPLSGGRP